MTEFFDAFISYGRADSKAFATRLYKSLLDKGYRIWFDQNDIPLGVDFQNQIDDGIEQAHNFLFIIAPHSVNSPYCGKEIDLAIKRGKRIIPLLHVEQISRETWQSRNPNGTDEDWEVYQSKGLHSSFPNMNPVIGKINWVYFREETDDFDTSLEGLISIFERQKAYVERHTFILSNALHWERNQKQSRYLLVGKDKQNSEDWLKTRFVSEQPPCEPTDLHCEFICNSIKNANNLMTHVFLSYATQDIEVMQNVRRSLMREGFTVWANTTDIQTGQDFEDLINQGIEGADNIVYLLSPDALQSKYCQQEIQYAFDLNKRIIPLQIKPTETKKTGKGRPKRGLDSILSSIEGDEATMIESRLQSLQFINFIEHDDPINYQVAIDKLLQEIRQDAEYYRQHKSLMVRALKWNQQGHNATILLRGYNLERAKTWLNNANTRPSHLPIAIQESFIQASLEQPPDVALDLFISYPMELSDFARRLNESFQLQGKTTWFDQEIVGSASEIQQETHSGIEAAQNFVMVVSSDSINSPYLAEFDYATQFNKRIVVVLYGMVDWESLPSTLADLPQIDFKHYEGDFTANFNELVRTLETDREYILSHTKWLQRALEWDGKEQSEDLLLRGNELAIAEFWLEEADSETKSPRPTDIQRNFIQVSHQAAKAAEEEEKERQATLLKLQEERAKEAEARLVAEQKVAKRQQLFLELVSAALFVAMGMIGFMFHLNNNSNVSRVESIATTSKALHASDRELDALIEAIRAAGLQQSLGDRVDAALLQNVNVALQQAVYNVRETNRLAHSERVMGATYHPDGDRIVSVSDGTIYLWQADGALVNTIPAAHDDEIWDLVYSPNGDQFATVSDRTIKLWDSDGNLLTTWEYDEIKVAITYSSDGQRLITGTRDARILIWSLDGDLLRDLGGQNATITSLATHPSQPQFASASEDGIVNVWSDEGELLQTIENADNIWDVAISPDGEAIATAGTGGLTRIWSMDGELMTTLEGHNGAGVESVAFSPDGNSIITGGTDYTIHFWRRNGTLVNVLNGHENWVWEIAFGPDGRSILSAGWDRTVRIWRLSDLLTTLQDHASEVRSVAFSPDGEMIASASSDQTIKLWTVDGQLLNTLDEHINTVSSVDFSPDGDWLVSGSWDRTVRVWERDGTLIQTLNGHDDWVTDVAFSPNGDLIASGGEDNTVRLWDREGNAIAVFEDHDTAITQISFSPSGERLAVLDTAGKLYFWDTEQQELVNSFTGDSAKILNMAWSPDSQSVAIANSEGLVRQYTLDRELQTSFSIISGEIRTLAFSPDSTLLAGAGVGGKIYLWDLETGQLVKSFSGHQQAITDLTFSPDGEMMVSASLDSTLIAWELEEVRSLNELVYACDWVEDYLANSALVEDEGDRNLCRNVDESDDLWERLQESSSVETADEPDTDASDETQESADPSASDDPQADSEADPADPDPENE